MQILQKIDADKQIIGAQEEKKVWFDGWEENLIDFKNTGHDVKSLTPKFVRPGNPVRLDQKYVLPKDNNFELNYINVYRTWFEKYFPSVENIYEFGCGTGFNLLRASEVFQKKIYMVQILFNRQLI